MVGSLTLDSLLIKCWLLPPFPAWALQRKGLLGTNHHQGSQHHSSATTKPQSPSLLHVKWRKELSKYTAACAFGSCWRLGVLAVWVVAVAVLVIVVIVAVVIVVARQSNRAAKS